MAIQLLPVLQGIDRIHALLGHLKLFSYQCDLMDSFDEGIDTAFKYTLFLFSHLLRLDKEMATAALRTPHVDLPPAKF